jgi:hypothetical protein
VHFGVSEAFNFFRLDAEAISDDGQRLRVRLAYLITFDAGNLLGGDRGEVASLQPALLPQTHQRGTERPFALPALPLEPAPIARVKLAKDRIRRRFVVAQGDRPAIVGKPEPGKIGGRSIACFWEERERGNYRLDVATQQCQCLRLGIDAAADKAIGGVIPRDGLGQLLFGKSLESLDQAEDRVEQAEQGGNAL